MKTNYDWVCDTKKARYSWTPAYMEKPDFYVYAGQTDNPGFGQKNGNLERWYNYARKAKYGPTIDGRDIVLVKREKKYYVQEKVNVEEQTDMNTMRKVARDATTVGIRVICCNRNNAHKATHEAGTINKPLYNQVMKQIGAWELWKKHIAKK